MQWAILTMIAVVIWASLNMFDKFLVSDWVRNPVVPVIFQIIVGLIVSIPIALGDGLPPLTMSNAIWVLIGGSSFVVMSIFYFKGLQNEEVSRAIPVFYVSPIFVVPLAGILLGEQLSVGSYFGIGLIVSGAVLVSSRGLIRMTRAFWYMLFAALFLAISLVTTKYLLEFYGVWTTFAYTRIAAAILLVPLLLIGLKDVTTTIERNGWKTTAAMSLDEGMSLFGWYLITLASSTGLVILVNTLASTQPLFVFVFALLVGRHLPSIFKEERKGRTLLLKLIAILMIVIGTLLILGF